MPPANGRSPAGDATQTTTRLRQMAAELADGHNLSTKQAEAPVGRSDDAGNPPYQARPQGPADRVSAPGTCGGHRLRGALIYRPAKSSRSGAGDRSPFGPPRDWVRSFSWAMTAHSVETVMRALPDGRGSAGGVWRLCQSTMLFGLAIVQIERGF
jgi:hypothetical protein